MVAPQREEHRPAPGWPRGPLVAALLAAAVLGLVAWWWLTVPHLEGGGIAAVSSSDHEVVMGTGMDETVFVVPADTAGESLLAFTLHNAGRFPVELVDVWPSTDDPMCLWQPRRRGFRDEPQTMYTWDGPSRPVAGAVLAPGGHAVVWIAGAHPDPAGCEHGAFTTIEDVEVIARIGGRTSSLRVPLGYSFGWSDEPRRLEDSFGVEVIPPHEPLDGHP